MKPNRPLAHSQQALAAIDNGACWVGRRCNPTIRSPNCRVQALTPTLPQRGREQRQLAGMLYFSLPLWGREQRQLAGMLYFSLPLWAKEQRQLAGMRYFSLPLWAREQRQLAGMLYFSLPLWGRAGVRAGCFVPLFHVKQNAHQAHIQQALEAMDKAAFTEPVAA